MPVTVMPVSSDEEVPHTHCGVRGPMQGVRVDGIAQSFIVSQVLLELPHIKTFNLRSYNVYQSTEAHQKVLPELREAERRNKNTTMTDDS